MKVFLFCATLGWFFSSFAEAAPQGWSLGVAGEVRGRSSINQENLEWGPSWGLEGGYAFLRGSIHLESRTWTHTSESGELAIQAETAQVTAIGRWLILPDHSFYLLAGSGVRRTLVQNRWKEERVKIQGDWETLLTLGAGAGFPLWSRQTQSLLELRALQNETRWPLEISASFIFQYYLR